MATLLRSIQSISENQKGAVVTIGNFDGVHLGHEALLKQTIATAKELQQTALAITFEPHPYEFFASKKLTVPRLTKMREKWHQLVTVGIENVLILKFNQALATLSATQFVEDILYRALNISHIVVGDDFHFGKDREGDINHLVELGQKYHFTVSIMPTFLVAGERVSSTLVKQALKQGNLSLARRLLGRDYAMMGRVSHGKKLGRDLGCPTANISINRRLTPVHGIYTVKVAGIKDKPIPGVASIGSRPTIDGTKVLLEVHLLDFNEDIYGRHVEVAFCEKCRDEERFENLDLLKLQIMKDVEMARDYFKRNGGL